MSASAATSRRRPPASIYVDPYDAHVLGSPRGEAFFATVRRLHRSLLILGDAKGWGRPITGTVALGLTVMLASGLMLRWPRRAGSLKMWLKPNLGLSGRGLHPTCAARSSDPSATRSRRVSRQGGRREI